MSSFTLLTFFRALLARKLARRRPPPPARRIPAFSFDGARRLRGYSEAACLHLEAGAWATLRRNRRGTILAVIFRNEYGGDAMKRTLQPGQRYSFEDVIADSHVWQHQESILENERADFERSTLDQIVGEPLAA